MRRLAAWCVWTGVLSHAAVADAVSPAAHAFAVLQGLRGQWTILREGKTLAYPMTYDVASRGSIVTEQFGRELSVFYLDGSRLLMTHFCNARNQPRLQLRAAGKPGVLDFVMFDITGLDGPQDAHVSEVIYRIIDATQIKLSLVWTGQGTGAPEDYTLTKHL